MNRRRTGRYSAPPPPETAPGNGRTAAETDRVAGFITGRPPLAA
jgi:hypothetical protein